MNNEDLYDRMKNTNDCVQVVNIIFTLTKDTKLLHTRSLACYMHWFIYQ